MVRSRTGNLARIFGMFGIRKHSRNVATTAHRFNETFIRSQQLTCQVSRPPRLARPVAPVIARIVTARKPGEIAAGRIYAGVLSSFDQWLSQGWLSQGLSPEPAGRCRPPGREQPLLNHLAGSAPPTTARPTAWRRFGPTPSSTPWRITSSLRPICWTSALTDFQTTLSDPAMPSVIWITAAPAASMHSGGGDMSNGIRWPDNLVTSVQNPPAWSSTATVVLWDESGGWYDHVPPPQLPNSVGLGAFTGPAQSAREQQTGDLCDLLTIPCFSP
jgi:Phosphoesterase family